MFPPFGYHCLDRKYMSAMLNGCVYISLCAYISFLVCKKITARSGSGAINFYKNDNHLFFRDPWYFLAQVELQYDPPPSTRRFSPMFTSPDLYFSIKIPWVSIYNIVPPRSTYLKHYDFTTILGIFCS